MSETLIVVTDIVWDDALEGTPTTHEFTVQGTLDGEEAYEIISDELVETFGHTASSFEYDFKPG